RPVADLFGGKLRTEIPIYYASGVRGNKPEEELAYLQKLVGSSGAKAIKFRLGGRMNKNVDSLPGRTEALIPLVRKTFGDDFTLYADSNSSYDAKEAIRIGKIMEANGYAFYEEPCEFDDLWSTKEVADALTIPVAGGEQEYSMHRWQWAIANRTRDVSSEPAFASQGGDRASWSGAAKLGRRRGHGYARAADSPQALAGRPDHRPGQAVPDFAPRRHALARCHRSLGTQRPRP